MSDEESTFKRVADTELGTDDLYDVWRRVKTLSPRWHFFSLSLHLSPDTLAKIEADNGSDCEKCLNQALTHWLKKDYNYKRFGHPSWRKLCVSVSHENKALAEEIADKLLIPTSPLDLSTDYEQTPSPLSVTSDRGGGKFIIEIDLVSALSELAPLSSVYTVSVSQVSQGSTTIADSVVYVRNSNFANEGQLFELEVKIKELQEQFLDNIQSTKESLQASSHSVSAIIEYVELHVSALRRPELQTFSHTSSLQQKFSSITTLHELFIFLKTHASWFNYEFIVKLANVFLPRNRSLKKKWFTYRQKLKDYFVNYNDVAIKCADGIEFGLSDIPGTEVMIAKVARDDYTLNDLFFFRQAIQNALGMSQYTLYFCLVRSGCLELQYSIPEFLYSVLFPLTDEQVLSLANIGVIKLSCGSFKYDMEKVSLPDLYLSSLDIYDPLWYENTSTPLHEASWKGLTNEVQWLINKFGYELFQRGRNGWNPLHAASYGGHLDVLSLLINQYHCDPSKGDDDNVSCLHVASYKGHLDIALYLLDTCNINPDVSDNSYNTALLYAAMGGHCDLVTLLLNRNCNSSQCNKEGATLSLLACKSGNIALVHKLEALALFLPNATCYSGRGVLHYSCMSDNVELVHYLMTQYQLKIDVTDQYGMTPFSMAARFSSSNVISSIGNNEMLLKLDIYGKSAMHYICFPELIFIGSEVYCKLFAPCDSPVLKNSNLTFLQVNTNSILQQKRLHLLSAISKQIFSYTSTMDDTTYGDVLCMSCYNGNLLLTKVLEEYNIKSSLDKDGRSLVHCGALSGSLTLLSYIATQYSLNINEPDYSGIVPLAYACQSGSVNAVEYIINSTDIDINTTDNDGMTCFHHSCCHGHLDVTQYLIDVQGIDVNMVDSKGRNGVHHAAYSGNQDLVEYLINEKSLLPTAVDSTGCTALHYGIMSMKLPLVKDLVNIYKLDPHRKDNSGKASVHYAAEVGDINVLEYLINSCNCELSISANNGLNIFHFSSLKGNFHFIKHILAHYPQYISLIHSPDNKGKLPIHLACQSGITQLVMYLVDDIKCDVTAKADSDTCVTYACISGNLSVIKLLTHQYKLDPLAVNEYGISSLHLSLVNGHIHIVEWIANQYNINVATHCNKADETLLHTAAAFGWSASLQHLVNTYQCDVNATTSDKGLYALYTPLHFACQRGHVAAVCYLTSLPQCNITAKTSNHLTIIHLTCKSGSLSILKHLVENYSDQLSLYAINDDGKASIHLACEKGALNIIKYIIECSPDLLDLADVNGYTPLLTAAYSNHLPVVKYLNSQNCNISVLDGRGFNVLHISSEKGYFDIVKYLIDGEYVDPNIADFHERTSLHIAVLNAQLAIVEYLMDSPNYQQPRVQFEVQDKDGNASLHIACETGQPKIVSILSAAYLSHDISILQTNNKGWTPLHCVAANGHVNTANTLLAATTGTPFYNELLIAVDKEGCTAFHLACSGGHYKMFLYLSNCYPVGVSAIDNRGRSLLHASCQSNSLELVQCLVSTHQLDTELHDKDGVTCLHLIAERGDVQMYQYIVSHITHELKVIPYDNKGHTPLHYSCLTGQYNMSVFLIKTFGCHPEDKDNNGFTPLHAACQSGSIKLVSYFLKELKCNPSVQTNTSKSLVYFASKSRNLGLVRLLIESYNLKVHSHDIKVAKSLKAEFIVQYLEFCLKLNHITAQLQERGLIRSAVTTQV